MSLPPEPRANPDLVGHGEAQRQLEAAARSGRLHHAWLLAGAPGIGKATLAWRFARWLLADMPRGEVPLHLPPGHPVFRRVAAGAHADVLALTPGGEGRKRRTIAVEDAREAVRFLTLTPAEGGWRVVLIDEPETMEAASANTLLKTLEEPNRRTVLLLASSAPGRLLPTIRSRCRRLDLFPLDAPEMEGLLARWLPDLPGEDRGRLARLAEGAPGRALLLAEGEGVELAKLAEKTLASLPRIDALALADRITGKDGAGFAPFFALLTRAMQAALREAAAGGGAEGWVAARPLGAWAEAAAEIARLAETAERLSLDRRQAVIEAMRLLRG
ncbi:MAG: DNA polymerase III subunit delta' [Acetobacteraceae bacterium]|nr:DNA polymerase III subunit delta' [Acetobacteraceae bacterium]